MALLVCPFGMSEMESWQAPAVGAEAGVWHVGTKRGFTAASLECSAANY